MKKRKKLSLMLAALLAAAALGACAQNSGNSATSATGAESAATSATGAAAAGESAEGDGGAASDAAPENASAPAAESPSGASYAETLVLDVFNQNANYQGLQGGWYGKILKDKFNIELNIIAPQLSGEAVYQSRASAGELGDLVILNTDKFIDCVNNGLIKDISGEFDSTQHLTAYGEAIKTVNAALFPDSGGAIYTIPHQMVNTSPIVFTADQIFSFPQLRWDLYKDLGMPEIADMDGLLDTLEAMMKAHPENDAGEPAYAFSLWADWDDFGMENVVQFTTWFGEKQRGSALHKPDNTFAPLTDKTAAYYAVLKWLNTAYRRGLVDPDSGTQDWSSVSSKYSSGRVYLEWYIFMGSMTNTTESIMAGKAFEFVPLTSQVYYADADEFYGTDTKLGVGAQVSGEKYDRIIEFIDWYVSPENMEYTTDGIKGFTYDVAADGTYYVVNPTATIDNLPVPEEYGGGGYADGQNHMNMTIGHPNYEVNPNTGEAYSPRFWASYLGEQAQMDKEWQERFGATDDIDYMLKNNAIDISPAAVVTLATDTTNIALIRGQCKDALNDGSWRMVYAQTDAEFDKMWDEMAEQLEGLGYAQLYEFDCAKYQPLIDAKIEIAKQMG